MDSDFLLRRLMDLEEEVQSLRDYINNIQVVPPLHSDMSAGNGLVLSLDRNIADLTVTTQVYLAVSTSIITGYNTGTGQMGSGTVEIYGLQLNGTNYFFTDASVSNITYNLATGSIPSGTNLILVVDSYSGQLVAGALGTIGVLDVMTDWTCNPTTGVVTITKKRITGYFTVSDPP